jgi:multidrug resistance efflux pump
MEILLCLIYVALCYATFRIFRIPVNQWSLSTAAFGGIVGIALLLLVMNYNHPFSRNARIYFAVTPVLPGVRGRVTEVTAKTNEPLNEGDVLFKIDPRPFQYVVDQKRASLAEAEQQVRQLKASLDQASAEHQQAQANLKLQEDTYDRQAELFQRNVVAQAALDTAQRNRDASRQAVSAAAAVEDRARLAYSAEIGGTNPTVARLQAELGDAQYDLEQTTVRAPAKGFVTQVGLRPGMYVVPIPLRPAMVFVHTGSRDQLLGAAFQQNSLQRVKAGDEAEVAFDGVPGHVFKGKVAEIVEAIAAGQLAPSGTLQDLGARPEDGGRVIATISLDEDMSAYQLPPGASAEVAIYTEHWHHIALLRKILLRMRSWENYVFIEGH